MQCFYDGDDDMRFNYFLQSELFHPYQVDESIFSFKGCLVYFFILM